MSHPEMPNSHLLVQQGPSCWLYVVESVVRTTARNKFSTKYLRMAMHCYPDSDTVATVFKAQDAKSSRQIALDLLAANVDGVLTSLDNWRQHHDGDTITLGEMHKFARRNGISYDAWTDPELGIVFEGDSDEAGADFGLLFEAFTKAGRIAKGLVKLAATAPENDEAVAGMLNTGFQQIDHEQQLSDVVESLKVQPMPSYFAVYKRFSLTQQEREQLGAWVDFTAKPVSQLKETAHAMMLEAFVPNGATDGKVYFKDPNYGDVHFVVTVAQFQAMSAAYPIKMRPFLADGKRTSALANVVVDQ